MRGPIAILAACVLLVGCDCAPGHVGDPCEDDADCEGGCLLRLEGDWLGQWQRLDFPAGMCTDGCETPGEWGTGYNICLTYAPTGDNYLFPTCRNGYDCRGDEGYRCMAVGNDVQQQPVKACLPPGS